MHRTKLPVSWNRVIHRFTSHGMTSLYFVWWSSRCDQFYVTTRTRFFQLGYFFLHFSLKSNYFKASFWCVQWFLGAITLRRNDFEWTWTTWPKPQRQFQYASSVRNSNTSRWPLSHLILLISTNAFWVVDFSSIFATKLREKSKLYRF